MTISDAEEITTRSELVAAVVVRQGLVVSNDPSEKYMAVSATKTTCTVDASSGGDHELVVTIGGNYGSGGSDDEIEIFHFSLDREIAEQLMVDMMAWLIGHADA